MGFQIWDLGDWGCHLFDNAHGLRPVGFGTGKPPGFSLVCRASYALWGVCLDTCGENRGTGVSPVVGQMDHPVARGTCWRTATISTRFRSCSALLTAKDSFGENTSVLYYTTRGVRKLKIHR